MIPNLHERLLDRGESLRHARPLVEPLRQLLQGRVVVLFHELAQHRAALFVQLRAPDRA